MQTMYLFFLDKFQINFEKMLKKVKKTGKKSELPSGPFSMKTCRFSLVSDYLSIGKSPVIQNISRANPIIPNSRSKGIPINNSNFTRARVQEA